MNSNKNKVDKRSTATFESLIKKLLQYFPIKQIRIESKQSKHVLKMSAKHQINKPNISYLKKTLKYLCK